MHFIVSTEMAILLNCKCENIVFKIRRLIVLIKAYHAFVYKTDHNFSKNESLAVPQHNFNGVPNRGQFYKEISTKIFT